MMTHWLRHVVLFALLLAYGTQLLGAVHPCATATDSAAIEVPVAAAMSDPSDIHAHHNMKDMASAEVVQNSCCDLGFACDMSQCSLSFGLPQQAQLPLPVAVQSPNFALHVLLPAFLSDSLYHPPRLV